MNKVKAAIFSEVYSKIEASAAARIQHIMEYPDIFTLLPIQVDPSTKGVSTTDSSAADLQTELALLNVLHRSIVGLDTPNSAPPPPVPVKPQRSQQIAKLRESGNALFKKQNYADAVRMYSLGLEMALGRPQWEPQGLVREEVAGLYSNRAQAWMSQSEWSEGAVDAELSVEMKKVQNAKAWWRKGKCLIEMEMIEEAKEWVAEALTFEAGDPDLTTMMKDIEVILERRG